MIIDINLNELERLINKKKFKQIIFKILYLHITLYYADAMSYNLGEIKNTETNIFQNIFYVVQWPFFLERCGTGAILNYFVAVLF